MYSHATTQKVLRSTRTKRITRKSSGMIVVFHSLLERERKSKERYRDRDS